MSLKNGTIIQLTGLSGSGKSTLANGVKEQLENQGYKVAVIDGDVYRKTLCSDLGFSKADRIENIRRLGRFSKVLVSDFDIILLAAINPYEEARNTIKEEYGGLLVFIDCPLDIAIQRDPKGLYKKALLDEQNPEYIANFTGISDPYEIPKQADLVLKTGTHSEQACITMLVDYIKSECLFQGGQVYFRSFLSDFRNDTLRSGNKKDKNIDFLKKSKIFKALFELDNWDLYQYLFTDCKDDAHFESWLRDRIGETAYLEAIKQFSEIENISIPESEAYELQTLTTIQVESWEEDGYLVLSQFIDEETCDAIREVICKELQIVETDPNTWCPSDPRWQGIMLFSVRDETVERLRRDGRIRAVFEDLYQSKKLIPVNTPLGYMPPLSTGYPFKASPLHWDIDIDLGLQYHIQGMVYLQDVEDDGGAFSLIPGIHKNFHGLIAKYGSMEGAQEWLRDQNKEKKIAGKKGDLILWIESMPHAATPNESDQPRFVQYISFECIDAPTVSHFERGDSMVLNSLI